jgi:hypothetical protein
VHKTDLHQEVSRLRTSDKMEQNLRSGIKLSDSRGLPSDMIPTRQKTCHVLFPSVFSENVTNFVHSYNDEALEPMSSIQDLMFLS